MARKGKRRPPRRTRTRAPQPRGRTAVTTDGDPVAYCTARYRHTGMDEIIQILAQANDFSLGDHSEPDPDGSLYFDWYELEPRKPPVPASGRRVLAGLQLTAETLSFNTMSESRLVRCRERLETLLGDRLHLLREETKSIEQALAETPYQEPPEPVTLPPETLARMKEELLQQWIHASIPALGGMSPLEAVRTLEGRQMVLDLLDYIERERTRHPPPPGTFSADYDAVRKALGLE